MQMTHPRGSQRQMGLCFSRKIGITILYTISFYCHAELVRNKTNALPAPTPFAVDKVSTINAVAIGKNEFTSDLLTLQMSSTGAIQLLFTSGKERFGGFYYECKTEAGTWNPMLLSKHNIPGTVERKGNEFVYETGIPLDKSSQLQGLLRQTSRIDDDGKINISAQIKVSDPDKLKSQCFSMVLTRAQIGGTSIDIDGSLYKIKPFLEKEVPFALIYEGRVGKLILFSDSNDKKIILDIDGTIRIRRSNYGLLVDIFPDGENGVINFKITPGMSCTPALSEKYVGKIGEFNFSRDEAMRLPFRAGKNLLPNPSFEQGFRYLFFPQYVPGKYSSEMWNLKPFQIDNEHARSGNKCLKIISDNPSKGLVQWIATHPVMLVPGKYTFSCYARSNEKSGQKLTFHVVPMPWGINVYDKSKWPSKTVGLDNEWRRHELTVNVSATVPLQVFIWAESGSLAQCYVDDMQLEPGSESTEYSFPSIAAAFTTSAPDNFIEYGDAVGAMLELQTAPGEVGSVSIKVLDFFGRSRYGSELSFRADNNGKAEIQLPLDFLPRGIFVVECYYRLAGGAEKYDFYRLAIMSSLHNQHRHKNMFANVYIDQYGTKQFYPELLNRYKKIGIGARAGIANGMKLLSDEAKKYGVDTFSLSVAHHKKYPDGKVRFQIYNNKVGYAIPDYKMEVLLDDYRNLGMEKPSEEYLQQMEKVTEQIVRLYPGVKQWCFHVEFEGIFPEIARPGFCTDESFMDFVKMEMAVGRGIRKVDPALAFGNSPTANLNADRLEFFDRLLKHMPMKYDVILAHLYRKRPESPDLDRDFQSLFGIMDKYGYQETPVYCPEGMHWSPYQISGLIPENWCAGIPWGPFSYDMGWNEKLSAAFRARTWLIGLKNQDRVKLINSSANFTNFEMDAQLTPFATQKISNTLGRLLGDATFQHESAVFPGTRCYIFEDSAKRPLAVLWSFQEELEKGEISGPEFSLKLPGNPEFFDLMEEKYSLSPEIDGSRRVVLSPFPIFIRGLPGETSEFIRACEQAAVLSPGIMPVKCRANPVTPDKFKIELMALINKEIRIGLNCMNTVKEIPVSPKAPVNIELPLPDLLTFDKIVSLNIPATVFDKDNNKEFPLDFGFRGLLVKKTSQTINVDGNDDDWKNIPKVKFPSIILGRAMKGKVPAPDNLSGYFQIAWDERFLYLYVSVVDDKFEVNHYPNKYYDGWRNDSLQVGFDCASDARMKETGRLDENDWSYAFYPDADGLSMETYLFHVPDLQLTDGSVAAKANTVCNNVRSAFKKTSDGYAYELAFPARSIQPLSLKKGATFGLGLLVNDCDGGREPGARLSISPPQFSNPISRPDKYPVILLTN